MRHRSRMWAVFPLFTWRKCSVCLDQFRLERGWVFEVGPYHSIEGSKCYVCRKCCPDRESVAQWVQECYEPQLLRKQPP